LSIVIDADPREITNTVATLIDKSLLELPPDFDSFDSEFAIEAERDSSVFGFLGWFDVEKTEGV
jgi:hypothetical protein